MRVRTAHVSLQFGDTDKQHSHDIEKIFDRAVSRRLAWITGTEAGPGAGNTGDELLEVSRKAGYRPWVPSEQSDGRGKETDCWLAVRNDLIVGDWDPTYTPVIPGSQSLYDEAGIDVEFPRWGPKGLVAVGFKSLPQLGDINLAVTHHLTGGRDPKNSVEHGVDHYKWNERLDEAIAEWMRETAHGSALAFCTMDRNSPDTKTDTQHIGASTTLADELHKWQATGHGPIDWMLSYNKDGRVKGQDFNVLDDREFSLNTDHFFVEGTYSVEPLKH